MSAPDGSTEQEGRVMKIGSQRLSRLWLLVVLAGALSAVAIAPNALATPPTKVTFDRSGSLVDPIICDFPVLVSWSQTITQTLFFDRDGNLIRRHRHYREQDSFSANGTTLTGEPYSLSGEAYFENGVIVSFHLQGVQEKVPLPDGSLFIVAGQASNTTPSSGGFFTSVDHGTNGNLAAFCAALSA
jgi:hypothetical protein